MTTRRTSSTLLVSGALVLVLLVGGGWWLLQGDKDGPPVGDWSAQDDPVAPGATSIAGSVVTLPDGSEVDVGAPVAVYVVGGAGVYFLPEGEDELRVATVDGDVAGTGAHPEPDSLHVSPDGRYLAFLEADTLPWKAVVVDLVEGEEIVRSTDGMGRGIGLEERYAEHEPTVLGLTNNTASVLTVEDGRAFDLGSGDGEVLLDRTDPVRDEPWYAELEETADVLGPQRPRT